MVANFIAANQPDNVLDDGNLVTLLAQFTTALASGPSSGIVVSISGTSGQIKFPGASGLTIKWGTTPLYGLETVNIFTFPALGAVPGAFPNACFGVLLTGSTDNSVGFAERYVAGACNYTPSSFQLNNDATAGTFFYVAIGN
jgi:hypothetical protein